VGYIIVSAPRHGTLSGSGANLIYTPEADYRGPDSFTFKASDGIADSDPATVSIPVDSVNDAPVATSDTMSTKEDTPLVFAAGKLLGNDTPGPANESDQTVTVRRRPTRQWPGLPWHQRRHHLHAGYRLQRTG
jgi:hypothetical protein